jgi:GNAT superfamily N-acetyltransferase
MHNLLETFHFVPLSNELLNSSHLFDCGHPDLNDFFRTNSHAYSNQLLGKSYCFTSEENPAKIICAFTISNDSIKVSELPNSRKKLLIRHIPHLKHMRNYPAVLIGRLGVDREFQGHNIGGQLLDFIKAWFIDEHNKTGCRFIIVDAYNETAVLSYYLKNQFQFLFSTANQEKTFFDIDTHSEISTRLMFFDLLYLTTNKSADNII